MGSGRSWGHLHLSMEVKLKDYLDGATVLFDAAGNVVDGRLAGEGHVPHLARGHG